MRLRLKRHTAPLMGVLLCVSYSAQAVTVSDDFTQTTDTNNWTAQFDACLTAGTSTNNNSTNSNIPGCNYATPDAAGRGALRLTPAATGRHGAIVSNYTFPSNQGLDVTFTTFTYGGSRDGLASEGADGIGFFLMDGKLPVSYPTPGNSSTQTSNLGSWGGSLAYSCSNTNSPYIGLTGAYLGLGIDEYGNFLNGGPGNDNTATGIATQSTCPATNSHGCNSFINASPGSNQQANRIGLRGAGNVSWYWLNGTYPNLYPASLSAANQLAAVQNTCKTGTLWDYSGAASTPSQAIKSATVSANVLTVTLNGPAYYLNGDSVTLTGLVPVAPAPLPIGSASLSGSSLTLSVPSTASFSASNQTISLSGLTSTGGSQQPVTGTPSLSGTSMTVSVGSTAGFSVGQTVSFTGLTAKSGSSTITLTGPYSINRVRSGTSFTVTLPGSYTNPSASSASVTNPSAPANLNGSYTVVAQTGTSFTVNLVGAQPVGAIGTSSATATLPTGTISGSYTISNVTTTTDTSFAVTLNGNPASVTINSGSATDTTQSGVKDTTITKLGTSPTLLDYPAIPNGYWVLPATQKIANEAASSRASAWPITYKLRLTAAGKLNFSYSFNGGAYQSVLKNWPIAQANGPIPDSFRFGFTGSTGGSDNVHEITCFVAQPSESSSSAAANTVQSGQVRTGTQVYLARYDPNEWFGSLVSDPINVDSSGNASISSIADWDANCVLTGGGCPAMGVDSSTGVPTTSITAQSPSSRTLLTWNGSAGVPLQWSNLTTSQQANLNTNGNGQNVLNWFRGDRSNEEAANPPGSLRARAGVLGDVVNSSPVWVGPPSKNYGARVFKDLRTGATGTESSYATFQQSNATRQNVVYVGANDGLLHGFRAGNNKTDGSYDASTNDGQEVIGFMPATVIGGPNTVGLTDPNYGHSFYVDATVGTGDLYYKNSWHTWLVSGVGSQGQEIFALDITDPTGANSSTNKFAEGNASSLVVGDWTSSTLTSCTNASSACGNNLGNTVGTPIIRRMHNGQWAIIFGNGLNSTSGKAGVFVGLVAPSTGAVTFVWLDTGWTGAPNGISYVSSGDLDGDFITDYLYAGDVQGNLWRFDVTSSDPSQWSASTYGRPSATPLFVAKDASGNRQPISTSVAVTAVQVNNSWRVMLGLGTGLATPFTASSPISYQGGTQSVYGIWDWDMANWNSNSSNTYAYMPEITTSPYRSIARSQLFVDSLKTENNGYRTMAQTAVCWADGNSCNPVASQYGWLFDLPSTNEQVVYNPIFSGGELLLNSTIPPVNTTNQCTLNLPTGWSMAFDMITGGGEKQNVFPDSSGSFAVTPGNYSITGVSTNAVGTPYIVSVGSKQYAISQTAGGSNGSIKRFNAQGGVQVKRISWEQLR